MSAPGHPPSLSTVAEQFLDQHLPTPFTGRLLVALSGGADSTALLLSISETAHAGQHPLEALHFNHAVQDHSDQWQTHSQQLCDSLGLALHCGLARGWSRQQPSETELRQARYDWMNELMKPGDVLLTAHHRDDLAETLLLNLMRASGIHGQRAIAPSRTFGPGLLLRPFLQLRRSRIESWLQQRGVQWMDDPSNRDPGVPRSFIRHQVIPELQKHWPDAAESLARSAELSGEAAALVDEYCDQDLDALVDPGQDALSVSGLQQLQPARQRAVIRRWIQRRGFPAPPASRLMELQRQLSGDGGLLIAWPNCELRRYRDGLRLMHPLLDMATDWRVEWHRGACELPAGLGRLEWRRLSDNSLVDGPVPPLSVDFDPACSRFRPAGSARTRTLKNLFQEQGIPPWERVRIPRIYRGQELIGLGDLLGSDSLAQLQQETQSRLVWQRGRN